jgi:precorrin-6B methylase 2
MNTLHEAVWELAAIVIALRDAGATDPAHRRAAEHVLLERGLMVTSEDGPQPCTGLSEVTGGDPRRVAALASTGILQSAAVLTGAKAWTTQDDMALVAQGRASAQGVQPFKMFGLPMMAGLGDLMSGPSPVMLDVGVGIAALAVAYCEVFPGLRVVGIDVFPRALELARTTVDEAGMADRIELRHQDVAQLQDVEMFCLGWLPAPFVPRAALEEGLPRMVAALVPGGWIMVGHRKFDESGLSSALTRFQTIAFRRYSHQRQ